jgi:hypothetical protein
VGIWQDLVDQHGYSSSYQSVQRFVHKLREAALPEAASDHRDAAGEEVQVDYGTGPMVRDPDSGKYRRTRLFVILGKSRIDRRYWENRVSKRQNPLASRTNLASLLLGIQSSCGQLTVTPKMLLAKGQT